MATLRVRGHTGLTHPFKFFSIRALWRVPTCQKLKNSELHQYGAEHFGRLIFATIRKSVEPKGLTNLSHGVNGTLLPSASTITI